MTTRRILLTRRKLVSFNRPPGSPRRLVSCTVFDTGPAADVAPVPLGHMQYPLPTAFVLGEGEIL